MAGVRADEHDGAVGVREADGRVVSERTSLGASGGGRRCAAVRDAVERRRVVVRARRPGSHHAPRVRSGRGRHRRGRARPAPRRRGRADARHRRDDGEDLGGSARARRRSRRCITSNARPASAGYPIQAPVVEIVEIGAGGGSIAWVDDAGGLHVGPRSAGAEPGPACYGRGGEEPTLTDANLVAGRLDPGYFLGGTMPTGRRRGTHGAWPGSASGWASTRRRRREACWLHRRPDVPRAPARHAPARSRPARLHVRGVRRRGAAARGAARARARASPER